MSDEGEPSSTRPRTSRFKEHTNTSSSIRPPPDELLRDLGIEQLIEQFNEDNKAPPISRKSSGNGAASVGAPTLVRAPSDTALPPAFVAPLTPGAGVLSSAQPVAPAASESTFVRLQRAWQSVFGGVLGKRKAGNADAERGKDKNILDERKKAAEAAYREAKEQGLLPTPKVFVRPSLAAKANNGMMPARGHDQSPIDRMLTLAGADAHTPVRPPRTPTLYHTPSKKDLQKQKKLSKRVSDLEFKLASARKELHSVLYTDLPPVPPLPAILPPTPGASQSEDERNTQELDTPVPEPPSTGKLTKKRKAITIDDEEYKPATTDSEGDIDLMTSASEVEPERTIKRVKSSASRKNLKRQQSSRLQRKRSRSSAAKDVAVTVKPNGDSVPPIPSIPKGVEGNKVKVNEDGYGGLEHEMF